MRASRTYSSSLVVQLVLTALLASFIISCVGGLRGAAAAKRRRVDKLDHAKCSVSPDTYITSTIYISDPAACKRITDERVTVKSQMADALEQILARYSARYNVPSVVRVPCMQIYARDAAKLGFLADGTRCGVVFMPKETAMGTSFLDFAPEHFSDFVAPFEVFRVPDKRQNYVAAGNLLALPPTSKNVRLLIGSTFDAFVPDNTFWKVALPNQDSSLSVSTFWLLVGHIDEVVSVVPTRGNDFAILIPKLVPSSKFVPKPSSKRVASVSDVGEEEESEKSKEKEEGNEVDKSFSDQGSEKSDESVEYEQIFDSEEEVALFSGLWDEIAADKNKKDSKMVRAGATNTQKHIDDIENQLAEEFGPKIVKIPMAFVYGNGERFEASRVSPNPLNHLALRLTPRKTTKKVSKLSSLHPILSTLDGFQSDKLQVLDDGSKDLGVGGGLEKSSSKKDKAVEKDEEEEEELEEKVLHVVLRAPGGDKKYPAQRLMEKKWKEILETLDGDHSVEFIDQLGDISGGLHCLTLEEKAFQVEP